VKSLQLEGAQSANVLSADMLLLENPQQAPTADGDAIGALDERD
jgi:hypothetical protein